MDDGRWLSKRERATFEGDWKNDPDMERVLPDAGEGSERLESIEFIDSFSVLLRRVSRSQRLLEAERPEYPSFRFRTTTPSALEMDGTKARRTIDAGWMSLLAGWFALKYWALDDVRLSALLSSTS